MRSDSGLPSQNVTILTTSPKMDFLDQLSALASRSVSQLDNLQTEEATKMALVAPFINALGYNVFDPTEVVPEFVADVGVKKGEKVDYAIMKDGKAIILFECKAYGTNLDIVHREQLFRYFSVTEARIGVLTDGIIYRFYTDLEESNKMDERPFLEINLLDLDNSPINEVKKLTKSAFNLEEMLPAAWELKYIREFKRILNSQVKHPGDEFVRVLAKEAYSGVISARRLEQFREITKQAIRQFINEQINARLQTAMKVDSSSTDESETQATDAEETEVSSEHQIVTTEEELEGYRIARAILAQVTDAERITYKDRKTYFNVLLDNNVRRQICRFYSSGTSVRQIVFFDQDDEQKLEVDSVHDLYKYADRLKATFERYENKT